MEIFIAIDRSIIFALRTSSMKRAILCTMAQFDLPVGETWLRQRTEKNGIMGTYRKKLVLRNRRRSKSIESEINFPASRDVSLGYGLASTTGTSRKELCCPQSNWNVRNVRYVSRVSSFREENTTERRLIFN